MALETQAFVGTADQVFFLPPSSLLLLCTSCLILGKLLRMERVELLSRDVPKIRNLMLKFEN